MPGGHVWSWPFVVFPRPRTAIEAPAARPLRHFAPGTFPCDHRPSSPSRERVIKQTVAHVRIAAPGRAGSVLAAAAPHLRGTVLRALLIGLSENRPVRSMAERSIFGLRLSGRFVAGTTIEDAMAA